MRTCDTSSAVQVEYYQPEVVKEKMASYPSPTASVELSSEATPPEDQNETPPAQEVNEPIKYRIEYRGMSAGPTMFFDGKEQERVAEVEPSVFEFVDVRLTNETLLGDRTEKTAGKRPHEVARGNPYIKITSPAVCEALRCVVDYFPAVDLSRATIRIEAPYAILVFYEEALTEYRERLENSSHDTQSPACGNRFAAKHIKILQDFVHKQVGAAVDAERELHAKGLCTFDMLWLLYKPGTDVYYDKLLVQEHEPAVVSEVDWRVVDGATNEYQIFNWTLSANSENVGPNITSYFEYRFPGEKDITTLGTYPCEYLRFSKDVTEQDVKEIKTHFIERGKKWYRLRRGRQCQDFDGITARTPRRNYTSLVMVDPVAYASRDQHPGYKDSEPLERCTLSAEVNRRSNPLKICSCVWCEKVVYCNVVQARFAGYFGLNPSCGEEMTEHQYFLCDNSVEAFMFKTRQWELLHISGFQDPAYDKSLIERLVMKDSMKDLIKNLTRSYIRENTGSQAQWEELHTKVGLVHKKTATKKPETKWSADFVQGKGEGLTFLLHGKPGVGKTYTAECIANLTERPLLTLACSDIGVEPEEIEDTLLKWFKLAETWGAILLIDEADIYMEQRQIYDIKRNHLVAGFLRALEYFRGILFLTTNRVGTFDEAFVSRIHAHFHFEEFKDEDRIKVWDTFFQKLEEDREATMRIPQSTKDYIESEELRALKWNGREIRNAFQVAVALAESQGHKDSKGRILVKSDHIKATVQMSREFKGYLKSLWKQDESSRATSLGNRYDAYSSTAEANKGKGTSEKY